MKGWELGGQVTNVFLSDCLMDVCICAISKIVRMSVTLM